MFVIVLSNDEHITYCGFEESFKILGPFNDEHSANLYLRNNDYLCNVGGIYWIGIVPGSFRFARVSEVQNCE